MLSQNESMEQFVESYIDPKYGSSSHPETVYTRNRDDGAYGAGISESSVRGNLSKTTLL